ncbi:MAG TPA: LytR C-terminal domain-containing protein [Patescibacteria group bacterium]|nr:LytR C-terminal domain-containing protein [Patescibacteria group bacterium]
MRKTKNRRQVDRPKKWVFCLGLILFLSLFGLSLKVYLGFRQLKLLALSRINLVLLSAKNQLLVLSLEGRAGEVLVLPAEDKVKVPRDFGEYQLGKVYALGELEKRGGQLLEETTRELLLAPIFGYLYYPQPLEQLAWTKPKAFLKRIFWEAFWGEAKTDLRRADLALLFWRASRLNETLCETRDFRQGEETLLPDQRLREESLSLEILNATNHNGIAQEAAYFVEKAGGRVVHFGDAQESESSCHLLVTNPVESYTARWLATVFDCPTRRIKRIEGTTARADLILILGEDYWKKRGERW